MAARYHVRSISLPSRSHPTTLKIEEELSKLNSLESSSPSTPKSICNGLLGLENLYTSMDELLDMASTIQIFSNQRNRKWMDELVDEFMKLLDICGKTRDMVSQIQEQAQALNSALRRRKGDSSVRNSVANYTHMRKKMKKEALKLISATKQMDEKTGSTHLQNQDLHLYAVIRALKEVQSVNISIFASLLSFFTIQSSKSQPSRWSLVSKLMRKGGLACKESQFADVDVALGALGEGVDGEKLQTARKTVESLEISIEEIENELKRVFRKMIGSRARLLNVISQ